MGCGCGSNRKRQIKNKVSKAAKTTTTNNKKPVNSLKKDVKRKNRAVKIRAINKTLSNK